MRDLKLSLPKIRLTLSGNRRAEAFFKASHLLRWTGLRCGRCKESTRLLFAISRLIYRPFLTPLAGFPRMGFGQKAVTASRGALAQVFFLAVLNVLGGTFLAKEAQGNENAPYSQQSRIDYIEGALNSFWTTSNRELYNAFKYITVVDQNSCRSSIEKLRVFCLMEAARRNCRAKKKSLRKRCNLYSDIVVTNRLGMKHFINSQRRFHIYKKYENFHKQANIELVRHYGAITTEFGFSKASRCEQGDKSCLAKGVDRFCLDYADQHNMSWQYCVGAVLWIMGTNAPRT